MFILKRAGSGIKREGAPGAASCPVATLSCVRALSASGDPSYKESIEAGLRFIINGSFLSLKQKALHCGLIVNPRKLGYPVMTQFDSLTALIEISDTVLLNDPVYAGSFNSIMKKQAINARWKLEDNSRGMIPSAKGENRMVTLNVLRLLKKVVERES